MKKYLTLLLVVISLYIGIPIVNAIEFDLNSKNAILYNLDENMVLYEKNATEQISIASMTKIMTAIVALENIEDLD